MHYVWGQRKRKRMCIAVNGIPFHSYGVSLAIWDHTVLPATRHKWTHPALTRPYRSVLHLHTQRDGRLSWPRWLLNTEMVYPSAGVTHPSTNQVQCRLTTLIEANALTTTLCHHPWSRVMASSLYLMCSGMSCQWSSAWAATFNTHCNLLVTDWRHHRRWCCTSPCKMLQRHVPVTQQILY